MGFISFSLDYYAKELQNWSHPLLLKKRFIMQCTSENA